MRKKKLLYAVRKGFEPGVYRSWAECQRQVSGFSGAVYKSFKTLEEARTFVSSTTTNLRCREKVKPFDPKMFITTTTTKTRTNTTESFDSLDIYTDGSCRGNRNVKEKQIKAGWGIVVLGKTKSNHHSVFRELWGPVSVNKLSPYFMGAEHGSNNTGELQAIGEALLWLRDHEMSKRDVTIFSDSMYAMKTIKGEWQARKNIPLVKEVNRVLCQVRKDRTVEFKHVKGHSNHVWNDRADELANRGAKSTCSIGRYGEEEKSISRSRRRPRDNIDDSLSNHKLKQRKVLDSDDEFEDDDEFLNSCMEVASKVESSTNTTSTTTTNVDKSFTNKK